jgi:hypothetical protein
MKKPKAGKIRKIWLIRPSTRIKRSRKRELKERNWRREIREEGAG